MGPTEQLEAIRQHLGDLPSRLADLLQPEPPAMPHAAPPMRLDAAPPSDPERLRRFAETEAPPSIPTPADAPPSTALGFLPSADAPQAGPAPGASPPPWPDVGAGPRPDSSLPWAIPEPPASMAAPLPYGPTPGAGSAPDSDDDSSEKLLRAAEKLIEAAASLERASAALGDAGRFGQTEGERSAVRSVAGEAPDPVDARVPGIVTPFNSPTE